MDTTKQLEPPETMADELTDTQRRLASVIVNQVRAAVAEEIQKRDKRFWHVIYEFVTGMLGVLKNVNH